MFASPGLGEQRQEAFWARWPSCLVQLVSSRPERDCFKNNRWPVPEQPSQLMPDTHTDTHTRRGAGMEEELKGGITCSNWPRCGLSSTCLFLGRHSLDTSLYSLAFAGLQLGWRMDLRCYSQWRSPGQPVNTLLAQSCPGLFKVRGHMLSLSPSLIPEPTGARVRLMAWRGKTVPRSWHREQPPAPCVPSERNQHLLQSHGLSTHP